MKNWFTAKTRNSEGSGRFSQVPSPAQHDRFSSLRAFAPSRLVLLLPLLLLAGCRAAGPEIRGYYGPTLAMTDVIQRINQNNAALPTLFARHYLEANIHDPDKDKYHFINTGGDLFLRKPRELLLRGKKDAIGQVFELGSSADRYWMTVYLDQDTMWWGWYRNVGKPCARTMPIRPDGIIEVLGISDIPANLLEAPAPTMRFNNDLDVYMFVWANRAANQWYAEKEIWYDRQTLRPVKILLFDRNGRIVLRANLTLHKQVQLANVPQDQWPWIATHYDLFFPELTTGQKGQAQGSTMTLRLSDMALTSKTGQPKPGMIRFPEEPNVAKVIQIDADCEK